MSTFNPIAHERENIMNSATASDIFRRKFSRLGALVSILTFSSIAFAANPCQEHFGISFTRTQVMIGGIPVTDDEHYPLTTVLKNLGLNDNLPKRGSSVLSLGEGMSRLVPYFRELGVEAIGLDPGYHRSDYPRTAAGRQLRDYVRAHGTNLVQGDATDLPFNDATFDSVVSHMLVNNFARVDGNLNRVNLMIVEAIRVLKPGGEIRIFGFIDAWIAMMPQAVRANYGDQFEVSNQPVELSFFRDGIVHEMTMYLLVLKSRLPKLVGLKHQPLR